MRFDDLQNKISALISDYNGGLDALSDDRVTMAELHLARPAESCTADHPGLVFVVPAEFSNAPSQEPQTLSAAAAAKTSNAECCAVGWKGVVWNGEFVNCFPTPGLCSNFQGPNKCKIPGM